MAASAKISDSAFDYDSDKLEALALAKPWLAEPRYFTKTMVAASAAMKMLQHAQTGVERGMSRSPPVPIEIMGLMIGHVDPDDTRTLVVTDAFPLPVEGTETSVVADNPRVNEYMAELSESIEAVRKERLIGWYHSHPFDVREYPNWFFSMVDVQTQNAWQHQSERMGSASDPFIGIVIDPLRSLAKGRPEMGAFRNFKPDYKPPNRLVGPDNKLWPSEGALTERWGPACGSYYSMEVQLFQTTLCQRILQVLSREHLWARVLASTAMLDREARESAAQRVTKIAETLGKAEGMPTAGAARTFGSTMTRDSKEVASAARVATDVSLELLQGQAAQMVKYATFSRPADTAAHARAEAGARDASETGAAAAAAAASPRTSSSSSSSSAAAAAAAPV